MITRLNALRQRLVFAAWAAALGARLRRHGARLVVEAPHGVRFHSLPRVRVLDLGEGDGTTTLRIGRGVHLGRDLALDLWARGTNALELGDGAYFLAGARVELRGGRITLGDHSHVRDGAVLKSEGELLIGREVTVSFHDVIACTERVEIGDLVGLGERVTVTDSDHTHPGTDEHYLRQPLRVAPVRIEANVLVSAGAVILRGATVGANSVVGANAIVTGREHPAGHLLAGAPAKPVRRL